MNICDLAEIYRDERRWWGKTSNFGVVIGRRRSRRSRYGRSIRGGDEKTASQGHVFEHLCKSLQMEPIIAVQGARG